MPSDTMTPEIESFTYCKLKRTPSNIDTHKLLLSVGVEDGEEMGFHDEKGEIGVGGKEEGIMRRREEV